MSATCEICGRQFKTTQGLRGHKTFVHQMKSAKEPPAEPATEEELGEVEITIEQLMYEVEPLNDSLTSLRSTVNKQAEQLSKLTDLFSTTRASGQESNLKIKKCRDDIWQLDMKVQKLSRFIQYEFAGIEDDIIWEIAQDRPLLKKKSHKPK